MRLLTGVLILSFVGIGIFGVIAMHPNSSEALTRCLASLAQGAVCPEGNILSTVNFHLKTIKNFVSVILISAVLLLAGVIINIFSLLPALPSFNLEKFSEKSFYSINRRLQHWLALRENSPNNFKTRI